MADPIQDRVLASMGRMERTEIGVRQDVSRTQELLVRSVADIELEMDSLRQELRLAQAELQHTVERAKRTVGLYRAAVKRGDMQHIQNRIELWAPEQRITRAQLKRLLADAQL